VKNQKRPKRAIVADWAVLQLITDQLDVHAECYYVCPVALVYPCCDTLCPSLCPRLDSSHHVQISQRPSMTTSPNLTQSLSCLDRMRPSEFDTSIFILSTAQSGLAGRRSQPFYTLTYRFTPRHGKTDQEPLGAFNHPHRGSLCVRPSVRPPVEPF
jgi:hypothetical protein